MRDRLCNMEYNGESFEANPLTLALTHFYEGETPSPAPSTTLSSSKYIIIGVSVAGALSLISVIIAMVSAQHVCSVLALYKLFQCLFL